MQVLGCMEELVLWLKGQKDNKPLVEIVATLAPAEAEVGASDKAEQNHGHDLLFV